MGAIIASALQWFSTLSVARWLAFKAVAYALIVVILPIILWNLGVDWVETLINWVIQSLPQDSFVADISGLAGWFLIQLSMPQVVQVLVSALAARLLIRIIAR